MCSNLIQLEENLEVPCRTCDQCIQVRKHGWVARAMAEKATSNATFAFTLTYRNYPDGTKPLGASVFRYRDFQKAIGAIREAYKRKYNERGEVRYICAGERGSKFNRVHWHVIIYTAKPIHDLGVWAEFGDSQFESPIEPPMPERKKKYEWSLWPHGCVEVQKPDTAGMSYCLSYALKDQFNVVKAEGTKRITKADNHGAGMFRMSKAPPIGYNYLQQRIASWRQRGVVPPSLDIKIPDYSGFWYVAGDMRKALCVELHLINQEHVLATGSDCAQWSSLLASVAYDEDEDEEGTFLKTWDILKYGEIEIEEIQTDQSVYIEQSTRLKRRWSKDQYIVNRCGKVGPCAKCFTRLDDAQKRDAITDESKAFDAFVERQGYQSAKDIGSFNQEQRQTRRLSRWCCSSDYQGVVEAFNRVQAVERANQKR